MANRIPRDKNGVMGLLFYPEHIELLRIVEADDFKKIVIGMADHQWNGAEPPEAGTEFAKAIIPVLFNSIDVRLQKSKAGKTPSRDSDNSSDNSCAINHTHTHAHTHTKHTINSVYEGRAGAHAHTRERKRFVNPTVDEIKDFCQEENIHIDADAFFDYYESCGWLVGKGKPMANWKASVRRWWKNEQNKENSKSTKRGEGASFLDMLREGYGND